MLLVDPYNTSQQRSNPKCRKLVPKDIEVRWHSCPHCGLELDRDHNAAINILIRGQEVAHRATALSKPHA